MTHTTENSKEVLQGWSIDKNNEPDYPIYEGEECVLTVWASSNAEQRAELIVKAVNERQKLLDYIDYVEAKIDIDEIPMTFSQFQKAETDLKKYDTQ